jgi:hypothetical protein
VLRRNTKGEVSLRTHNSMNVSYNQKSFSVIGRTTPAPA